MGEMTADRLTREEVLDRLARIANDEHEDPDRRRVAREALNRALPAGFDGWGCALGVHVVGVSGEASSDDWQQHSDIAYEGGPTWT